MDDLCTSSRPVRPVSKGQSGGNQLVVTGLHAGGHTGQLWDHMDAGHPRATVLGTKLTDTVTEASPAAHCNLYCRLRCSFMDLCFLCFQIDVTQVTQTLERFFFHFL